MRKVHGIIRFFICIFAIIGMLMTPIILSTIGEMWPDNFVSKIIKLFFK